MAKVVITGASGLLGRALVKEFKEKGYTTYGFARTRASGDLLSVDLLDSDGLRAQLRRLAPDLIVHSAAARAPDQVDADPGAARRLNVTASEVIAKTAAEINAQLLYISTDYVFDGVSPPHKAEDKPNPLNLYGQTKYEGEQATLNNCPGALVFRVPILYGPVEQLAESAVTVLLNCLLSPPPGGATVSDVEKRYPAHVRDIAVMCRRLLEKQREDPAGVRGVYQWSGEEPVTKFGLVCRMAELFDLPMTHVRAVRTPPAAGARRPVDSRLDTSGVRALGASTHTPLSDGLRECLAPWVETRRAGGEAQ